MASVAMILPSQASFSFQDLRNNVRPRAHIQNMLHLAKAANLVSMHDQLTLIYTSFNVQLRVGFPAPTQTTTLGEFLEEADARTPGWFEYAVSPQHQQRQQYI